MGKGTILQPMFYGGSHERSRRAGTENVPESIGLGKAAEIAKQALDRGDLAQMAAMRDRIEQTILSEVEATGVNGEGAPRVPNTTNIHFDYIEGEALVIALDLKGLAVSSTVAVLFRSNRTLPRPNSHGIIARNSPRLLSASAWENKTLKMTFNSPSPSSQNCSPPPRALAGLQ